MATLALAVAVALALAACGGGADPIPRTALPVQIDGFRATTVTEPDLQEVAAEAIDANALAEVLRDSGFEAALERSYSGTGPGIRRVEVLLVRFGSASDADRFLEWQEAHVSDVIGNAELSAGGASGPAIYIHLPDGCCAKEQVSALAAWRHETDVVRVLVSGPDADGAKAAALIADLRTSLDA